VRIVSLVPSVTETLEHWGLPPAARTRFCPAGEGITVGGTKNPDIGAIIGCSPDLVVVEREENRRADYEALVLGGLEVLALSVRSLEDVNSSMALLAARVGACWGRIWIPATPPVTTRAFVPIWRRPWMALGTPTYGASLLASLGIATIHDDSPYPTTDARDVAIRQPDVVLAPSEPYPFSERHLEELDRFAPVRFVDGQDLFWWGARTEAARARLSTVLADLTG
jgi:ABC-type Fe3+-hydroxamate transport system substrate-binding protein